MRTSESSASLDRLSFLKNRLVFTIAFATLLGSCAVGKPVGHDAGPMDTGDAGRDAGSDPDSGSTEVSCGNGQLDEGENCDPAFLGAAQDLDCDCDDGNACTIDRCAAGTDVGDCSCICEHVPNATAYGVGSCNDSVACTNDTTACASPTDPRAPSECAATCEIACTHSTLPQCVPGCGNGVADPGETCENPITGLPAPVGIPACTCDDGNPCTLDLTMGSAASCTLQCQHIDLSTITDPSDPHYDDAYEYAHCDDGVTCTDDSLFIPGSRDAGTCKFACTHQVTVGWDSCDDGLACTNDMLTSSDQATCTRTCAHTPVAGWAQTQCDDALACTNDYVTSFDPATCAYSCGHTQNDTWRLTNEIGCTDGLTCTYETAVVDSWATCAWHCQSNVINNWWVTQACEDGLICTDGAVNSHDNLTCGYTCAQALNSQYVATALLACDDMKDCTTDSGSVNPSTCTTTCNHSTISNWWATRCNDGLATTTDTVVSHDDSACSVVCSYVVNPDAPDDTFSDANGDGVDGDVAFMIFVDTVLGNDTTGNGSMAAPYKTINRGITVAFQYPSTYVAVSAGTYDERVVLLSGVSVYGGYKHTVAGSVHTWTRDGTPANKANITNSVVSNGAIETVVGDTVTAPLTFERFTVTTGNVSTGGSTSTYGIRIVNSAAAVTIRFVTSTAGTAGNGTQPAKAATGNPGGPGETVLRGATSQTGGAAGTNASCPAVNGGTGGGGGNSTGGCAEAANGSPGNPPAGYPACSVGGGGSKATCGDYSPDSGGGGSTCGGVGGAGGGGTGAATRGSVAGHRWVPSTGSTGSTGGNGAPGSGGGGGGGDVWSGSSSNNDGGGGGGGGAGGCGGSGGAGGNSGGGSFGIFVSSATIVLGPSCVFAGGTAGNGSVGGLGGDGGGGGGGGIGRPMSGDEGGGGGNGGSGLAGGSGGQGGGGAGGISYGAFYCAATVSGSTPTYTMGTAGSGAGGGMVGATGPQSVSSGACAQ